MTLNDEDDYHVRLTQFFFRALGEDLESWCRPAARVECSILMLGVSQIVDLMIDGTEVE